MTTDNKQEKTQQFNIMMIHSLELALWKLFGDSTLAISNMMGQNLLELLNNLSGESIVGDTPQDTLTKMGHIFVEEFKIAEQFDVNIVDNQVNCTVQDCIFMSMEKDLMNSHVKPFMCPFHNVGLIALNNHGQFSSRNYKINMDIPLKRCDIKFEKFI